MISHKEASKKFGLLASGAPLSNIVFGKDKNYFRELCKIAASAIDESLQAKSEDVSN